MKALNQLFFVTRPEILHVHSSMFFADITRLALLMAMFLSISRTFSCEKLHLLMTCSYPLNLKLVIFQYYVVLCWAAIIDGPLLKQFQPNTSLVFFFFYTKSLVRGLVYRSAKLKLDRTNVSEIISSLINFLTYSCLRLIYLDFPLYTLLYTLSKADWLSQFIDTLFKLSQANGIFISRSLNQLA